jgi:hypothetical protein
MVAQRPPLKPRQLDASIAAQARPVSDLGRESKRADMDQASAAPPNNLSPARLAREARETARRVAGPASGDLLATRDAVRTCTVERVSVVDGADRMVYSEIRERKGWRQPLAAHEALSDARRRGGGDGDHAGEGARIVQTFEGAHERQARASQAGGPPSATPYALGKATVLANNSGRLSHSQSSARQQPSHTPPTRARTR